MSTLRRIPGYSQYSISIDGLTIVRHQSEFKKERLLKPSFRPVRGKQYPNGYMTVVLVFKDGVNNKGEPCQYYCYKSMYIHRLVAITWLNEPNSPDKTDVNHKDGNKLNNHATNLEWCTRSHNIKHSYTHLNREIKRGKEHHRYGTKMGAETRRKQSEAKKGEKHPKFKGWWLVNGRKFASTGEAAKALKTYPKAIYTKCLSGKDPCYKFLPIEKA